MRQRCKFRLVKLTDKKSRKSLSDFLLFFGRRKRHGEPMGPFVKINKFKCIFLLQTWKKIF